MAFQVYITKDQYPPLDYLYPLYFKMAYVLQAHTHINDTWTKAKHKPL